MKYEVYLLNDKVYEGSIIDCIKYIEHNTHIFDKHLPYVVTEAKPHPMMFLITDMNGLMQFKQDVLSK